MGLQGRLYSEGGGGRVGCEWQGTRMGAGRRQWDAATRAHPCAKRALWRHPTHAHEVFGKMPMPARGL